MDKPENIKKRKQQQFICTAFQQVSNSDKKYLVRKRLIEKEFEKPRFMAFDEKMQIALHFASKKSLTIVVKYRRAVFRVSNGISEASNSNGDAF